MAVDDLGSLLNKRDDNSARFIWFRGGRPTLETTAETTQLDDLGLASGVIGPSELGDVEMYQPLKSELDLYLEYFSIGNRSWQLRENGLEDFRNDEMKWATELIDRFGTLKLTPIDDADPFVNGLKQRFVEIGIPTVWDTLAEARDVSIVLLGHQFTLDGAEDKAAKYSARKSLSAQLSSNLLQSMSGLNDHEILDYTPTPAQTDQVIGQSVDVLRKDVATEISEIVTNKLNQERVRSVITCSFRSVNPESQNSQSEPVWSQEFRVSSLRGALWVQISKHIISESHWRNCRNTSCPRGLFRLPSPKSKKKYCDKRCKQQENNRQKYIKHPEWWARKKND
jgi:hypothetical protein